jgi:hypothetical protein
MNEYNEFRFNHITMRAVVQHYLNTVLLREELDVTVGSIDYSAQSKEFVIRIKEQILTPVQRGEDEPEV